MIIANWKAQGNIKLCKEVLEKSSQWENIPIVICPPYPYLGYFATNSHQNFLLGSQDCSAKTDGPYTGEVTCRMLQELDCKYVIIGHSDRRCFENNDLINMKLQIAKKHCLETVLCIGESISIKQDGRKAVMSHLYKQINNLENCDIIAYEPLWAIGTGLIPDNNDLQFIIHELQNYSNKKIIYGGSINANSIRELANIKNIDGFLIGNASLHLSELDVIINIYKGIRSSK